MNENITDPELRRFLKMAGYKDNKIDEMTPETRLLQDLGIKGDTFDETIELLHQEFDIDFSEMKIDEYSPSEGELLSLIEDMRRLYKWLKGDSKKEYKPVTLDMIAEAIRLKRWPYD